MKYKPRRNFCCLNNIYCSLYEVERFLNCVCKTNHIKNCIYYLNNENTNIFKGRQK